MTNDQVLEIFRKADAERDKRATDMPDEASAMLVMQQAHRRLCELGWADATYSPKDGTLFEALEAGCIVSGRCQYRGEWPKGGWWMHDAGDLWPSRPILWRKLADSARDTKEKQE